MMCCHDHRANTIFKCTALLTSTHYAREPKTAAHEKRVCLFELNANI